MTEIGLTNNDLKTGPFEVNDSSLGKYYFHVMGIRSV